MTLQLTWRVCRAVHLHCSRRDVKGRGGDAASFCSLQQAQDLVFCWGVTCNLCSNLRDSRQLTPGMGLCRAENWSLHSVSAGVLGRGQRAQKDVGCGRQSDSRNSKLPRVLGTDLTEGLGLSHKPHQCLAWFVCLSGWVVQTR